jgi:hypothetical protein
MGHFKTQPEQYAGFIRTGYDAVKEVFPDVNNYIDAESGKLMATNEELRKYIENSKQAAIEDAKKAALAGLSDQYVQAGQQYYTAEINRDMAREQANQAWSDLVGYIASKPGQEGFTGEGMSLEQLQFAAQSVANEFGESQETIHEWIRIYNEQTAAAQSYEGEMETLESTMHSLEAQLDIANAALERMSAAADSAASALGGSAGMTSGQYYNWLYSGKGFARGLDYVPSEGFYHLHAGERVQTAAEASLARQYGMQAPGMDYGSIGAAVWQNAPKIGGDVYLDNRIVGQVISASQGRSYRALQRSGWQG